MDHARQRCGVIYKESPCLVKFTKVQDKQYRATCGQDNNK